MERYKRLSLLVVIYGVTQRLVFMDEVTYLTVAYLYMTVKHECDLVSLVWFPNLSTPGMKKEWCQKYGWAGELVSLASLSHRRV